MSEWISVKDMTECVEREATIKRIKEVYCVGCNSYHGVRCRACGTGDAIDMIEDAPAADVAPVVHGEWEIVVGSNGKEYMVCTCCRVSQDLTGVFTYCPNCGAKMDGGNS